MTAAILVVLALLMLGLATAVTFLAMKGLAAARREYRPRIYYWLNQRWSNDKSQKPPSDK